MLWEALHLVASERGSASFSIEGGALRVEETYYLSHQGPAWPRERGSSWDGKPSPSGLLGPHLTAPFFTPPSHQLLLVLLWTLTLRLIDEYDTVLDLNVFMVHNPQQEEMEG